MLSALKERSATAAGHPTQRLSLGELGGLELTERTKELTRMLAHTILQPMVVDDVTIIMTILSSIPG